MSNDPELVWDRDKAYRELQARYVCSHPATEVRKRESAAQVLSIYRQCTTCGQMVGSRLKRKDFSEGDIAAMPPCDDTLLSRYWANKDEEWKRIEASESARVSEAMRIKYAAYRKTDKWKRKCELVMRRAQGVCEGCRERKADEVHHLTYEHRGDEFLFELVAICRPCHERIHGT